MVGSRFKMAFCNRYEVFPFFSSSVLQQKPNVNCTGHTQEQQTMQSRERWQGGGVQMARSCEICSSSPLCPD